MGREKFEALLEKVEELKKGHYGGGLWLYGTIGYGKSHLLAAVACYLIAAGDRVIYIPDCRQCTKKPVEYFRTAMLLSWADNSKRQEEIMGLETMEAIEKF